MKSLLVVEVAGVGVGLENTVGIRGVMVAVVMIVMEGSGCYLRLD